VKDEGRPFGAGFQEQASNHSKLLWSKATVVSVGVKVWGGISRQVRSGETSASKPFDDASIMRKCCRNRGRTVLPGRVRQVLGFLGVRQPAYRGREPGTGFCAELREPGLGCQGRSSSGESHEARVPMTSSGADQLVRAMKAGNAAGAKGLGQAAAFCVQLETGGGV
jgi:hypothetical protein